MPTRMTLAAAAIGATTIGLFGLPAHASPSRTIPCRASVSDRRPADYSTVYIRVHTAPGARIRTAAHYKTTTTSHAARADSRGNARIGYYTSGATRGRPVPVSVEVRTAAGGSSCGTAFTPR